MLPFLLYDVLYYVNRVAAFLVALLLQLVGFVLLALFWIYRTDLYVWGPSEYNLAERALQYKKNETPKKIGAVAVPQTALGTSDDGLYNYKESVKALFIKSTQNAIVKQVVSQGVLQILGFLLLTVATSFIDQPSFNVMWAVILTYVLFVLALLLLVYFIFLFVEWSREDAAKIASVNGGSCNGNGTDGKKCLAQQRYTDILSHV
jgi:hypothetical protein